MRHRGSKAPGRRGEKGEKKVKVNVTLDAVTAWRLRMQAAYEGKALSAVVADALAPRLRRWRAADGTGEDAVGPPPAAHDAA